MHLLQLDQLRLRDPGTGLRLVVQLRLQLGELLAHLHPDLPLSRGTWRPALGLVATLMVAAAAAAQSATADEALRARLEAFQPHQLGVDRDGHLWVFSPRRARAVLWDDGGTRLLDVVVPDAQSVDVEAAWGVVALSPQGTEVTVLKPDGTTKAELSLPAAAASVAWIDGSTVAIGSTTLAHRVEVWDVAAARRLRGVDEVGALPAEPGAQAARSTAIAYRSGRGFILLDRFSGRLELRDPAGGPLHEALANDPRREEFDIYLAERDAQARLEGRVERFPFKRFWLGVEPSGAAWTVESRDPDGRLHLLRLGVEGNVRRVSVVAACASGFFTVWKERMIFCQHPAVTPEPCCSLVEVP